MTSTNSERKWTVNKEKDAQHLQESENQHSSLPFAQNDSLKDDNIRDTIQHFSDGWT